MKNTYLAASAVIALMVTGCTSVPPASVVPAVDVQSYMGRWYELARFDFYFERGLDNTTADYTLLSNDTIKVLNRGRSVKTGKWKEAAGTARFRTSRQDGKLEVSFFGPFYAQYNIIALDENYRYALVAGKNEHYLWFLSRTPTAPETVWNDYLTLAQSAGFDTGKLLRISQTAENQP